MEAIKNQKVEMISALDVQDGDILIKYGYRVRASERKLNVNSDGVVVASFVLTSEPNERFPEPLPGGFNGGVYGGSKMAMEHRETDPR